MLKLNLPGGPIEMLIFRGYGRWKAFAADGAVDRALDPIILLLCADRGDFGHRRRRVAGIGPALTVALLLPVTYGLIRPGR
jgi:hypothetical protein